MLPGLKDEVGNQYGRLTVLRRAGTDNYKKAKWLCRCSCGNEISIIGACLRNGNSRSCGCLRKEIVSELRKLPFGDASFNSLVLRMKRDAKQRGYTWDLTDDEVKIFTSQPCSYCGAQPSQRAAGPPYYNGAYLYNGLDRVKNSQGYSLDNVTACCGACNRAKGIMTIKEFKVWICRIYEHFGSKP